MVAYSFASQFVEPVATLKKRQTVRGFRKRHARPGEELQLFTAMRTKHCRKILTPDPICLDVRHIVIDLAPRNPKLIVLIEIDGIALDDAAIEAFAVADGFGSDRPGACPRFRMGRFWLQNHHAGAFEGVVIRWEPR